MSKQTGAIVFSILFAVGIAGCASDPAPPPAKVREGASATPSSGIPPRFITGELQRIDGDFYYVLDRSGREVRFQVDPHRTKMDIDPKLGDQIRAEVAPQGYAYSISPAEGK